MYGPSTISSNAFQRKQFHGCKLSYKWPSRCLAVPQDMTDTFTALTYANHRRQPSYSALCPRTVYWHLGILLASAALFFPMCDSPDTCILPRTAAMSWHSNQLSIAMSTISRLTASQPINLHLNEIQLPCNFLSRKYFNIFYMVLVYQKTQCWICIQQKARNAICFQETKSITCMYWLVHLVKWSISHDRQQHCQHCANCHSTDHVVIGNHICTYFTTLFLLHLKCTCTASHFYGAVIL